MKAIFILFTIGLMQAATASDASFEVQLGDRLTKFELEIKKSEPTLHFSSNDLGKAHAMLSQKNYDYVLKRAEEISKLTGAKENCAREQAKVSYVTAGRTVEYSSCILGKDERAKALLNLLNVMSASF